MPAIVSRLSKRVTSDLLMVSLTTIEVSDLIRRPRAARISAIAASIATEGQARPLEVSPAGDGYRLTRGWVRLEALRSLGEQDAWCEVKRVSNNSERRQREIDDNLLGDGCTVLDRARYLIAAKALYEAQHPEVTHGGARRGSEFQVAKSGHLIGFHQLAAAKYGASSRSVRRSCAIGESLDPTAADLLADTEWADHQSALETLSRCEPSVQQAAARNLVRPILPAETMADAIAEVLGAPAEADPAKKAWSSALGGWGRMGAKDRREYLRTIAGDLPTGVRIVFDGEEA